MASIMYTQMKFMIFVWHDNIMLCTGTQSSIPFPPTAYCTGKLEVLT